jgi:PAS domain S-box-containing protein
VPTNSFSLYAKAKTVSKMLRDRLQAPAAPEAAPELHAALEEIHALWEELQAQSSQLSAERQHYAEFFEFAPDAYLITEPDGQIREANRAARELLGVKPELSDGLSLASFVPDPERPEFRSRLIAARGRPEGEMQEWRGNVLSGGVRDVAVLFRVRAAKARRKNAGGLCWLIRAA